MPTGLGASPRSRKPTRPSTVGAGPRLYRNRLSNIFRVLFAGLLIGAFAPGCSVQYVDDAGVRHVWGLAHVEIRAPAEVAPEVRAQQVTTLGLAFLRVPETQGLSLGYTRNFSLEVFAETAGELAYSPAHPIGFSYKGLQEIIEENSSEK